MSISARNISVESFPNKWVEDLIFGDHKCVIFRNWNRLIDTSYAIRDGQEKKQTSPIQIKISKFECSYITTVASSQNLRKADAQAFEHIGFEIPSAKNNLKVANQSNTRIDPY